MGVGQANSEPGVLRASRISRSVASPLGEVKRPAAVGAEYLQGGVVRGFFREERRLANERAGRECPTY